CLRQGREAMPGVLCADPPHSGCAARHSLLPEVSEEVAAPPFSHALEQRQLKPASLMRRRAIQKLNSPAPENPAYRRRLDVGHRRAEHRSIGEVENSERNLSRACSLQSEVAHDEWGGNLDGR